MRPRRVRCALAFSLAATLFGAVVLAGCSAAKMATSSSTAGGAAGSSAEKPFGPHGKADLPAEMGVTLRLSPGQAWKSRFASTSDVTWTLSGPDGKKTTKSRTFGVELIATQKVTDVSADVATIEINEASSKILQDGKFIEAPFRQFSPPNPVTFTLDTATGKADFSKLEQAYRDWMDGIKQTPAGEILGKTFRQDSFVAQLKELYGKPFTRLAGKTLSKDVRTASEKEFALPFLSPGFFMGPVPVEMQVWYEGFEVKEGEHFLKVAGKYIGRKDLTAEELAVQLREFDARAPSTFTSRVETAGKFQSTIDVLSGREMRFTNQLTYSTSASFDGSTVTEEIAGKATLDPAD